MSRHDVEETVLADVSKACNISTAAIEDIYDCTPSQFRMIHETKPDLYQFVFSLGSAASLERFRDALRLVISRNPTLRTRFATCRLGKTRQVVLKPEEDEEIISHHYSVDVDEYLQRSSREPGDKWLGVPLFRAAFIGMRFVVTIHHAVMDYCSLITLFNVDVVAAYYGRPTPDRPAFKEFVAYCNAIDDSVAKKFWQTRFRGVPACFPEVKGSDSVLNQMSGGAKRRISFRSMAAEDVMHSQIPHFIEAAWAMTSSIYTGNDSVAYGFLLSGRSSSSNGMQSTLGPTITEVPIQVDLQRNMTVGQLIKDRAVSLRQLQANPAVHCGLPRIIAASQAAKHAAAYRTLLNILPELPPPPPSAGEHDDANVRFERVVSIESPFPLHLIFNMNEDWFTIDPRFDPKAISESHLDQVLNQFEHVLQLLMEAPSQTKLGSLKLLNPHDEECISMWNSKLVVEKTAQPTLHEAFRAQARVRPDTTAVEGSDGRRINYRTLDQMSDSLACALRRRGISPHVAVGLLFERSLWAIVAMLGIMKAGGICVPLDISDSNEGRAAICSRVNAKLVLTSSAEYAMSTGLSTDVLVVDPGSADASLGGSFNNKGEINCCSTDTALVLFTNGSNGGEPQGVVFAHRNLVSSLRSQAKTLGWQPDCRVLHLAEYVSRWSICEVWGTLLSGGCICFPSDQDSHGRSFSTIIQPPQTDWAVLASSTLETISSSGGTCRANKVMSWASSSPRLVRGWGTCETSFLSFTSEVTAAPHDSETECIGFPIGCCSAWIVNPHNIHDLAPVGSVGELLVSGPGIARGYWADDAKTASSFIAPPQWATSFASASNRFYRTGYLARYNMDGSIALLGKRSNRVKIKGHTVQLEQLERSLRLSCHLVRDIAILTQIFAGRTQIVAVVCLANLPPGQVLQRASDGDRHLAAVREHAESMLLIPADVVAAVWIAVERLPWVDHQDLDRARIRQWLKALATIAPPPSA